MKKILSLLVLAIFLVPNHLDAAEIITKTEVNLDQNQNFEENLYIGAVRSKISSQIGSDLTILGGENYVSSDVSGDVFITGGKINFDGQTQGDLRIIGGQVSVSGQVSGDLIIVGAEVFVSKEAVLESDILLVGGKINFESNSNQNLKIISGETYLNGQVNGQSEITTQSLVLGLDAVIDGEFAYYSPQKFNEDSGAEILGSISYNKINALQDTGIVKKTVVNLLSFWLLLRFITTLIIGLILVYVFKVFAVEVNNLFTKSFLKSLLVGFLSVISLPIIITLFLVSLVAMPIGFLILLAFIFAWIIAPAIVGVFLGSWTRKMFGKSQEYIVDFHSVALGVVLYTLLQFVYWGEFIKFILILVALGAIARYLRLQIFK